MVEEILGIIEDLESDKTFSMGQIYSIYFTNERLIVAKTLGGMKRFAVSGAGMTGITGQTIGKIISKKLAEKRARQLAELHPDEILTADKHNFEIRYSELRAIELKKPHFMGAGKLKIISSDDEFPYKLMDKHDFEECSETVRVAVSQKLAVI